MFQKPKHSQGFAVLPQVHKPHIKKDRPTGAMIRRKEYVDENVATMEARAAPDRDTDHISVYGKGRNPWGEWGQPYKVARNGAFRPPIVRPTDLLPISRPRRETIGINNRYSAQTDQTVFSDGIDVKTINPGNKVTASAHTQISRPVDDRTQNSQVTIQQKDPLHTSRYTNLSDTARNAAITNEAPLGTVREHLTYAAGTNVGFTQLVGNAQPVYGPNAHKNPLYASVNRPSAQISIDYLDNQTHDGRMRTPLHYTAGNRPSGGIDVANANMPDRELVRRVLPVNTTTAISRADIITNHQTGNNIRLADRPSIAVIAAPTQNINIRDNTRYDLQETLPIQSFDIGRSGGFYPRTLENPTPDFNFQKLRANMPNHYVNPSNQYWTVPNNMMARPEDHRFENYSAMQKSQYMNQNLIARQNCPYARLSVQA